MNDIAIILLITNIFVMFAFNLMHLRQINNTTRMNLNGLSHVWGALMEMKLGEEE